MSIAASPGPRMPTERIAPDTGATEHARNTSLRRLMMHESLRSGARQLCLETLDLPELVAGVVSQYRAAGEAQRVNSHGQNGVGLGLSVALRAAKRLGAELSVESELGVGSTFTLALPPDQLHRKGASHGTVSQSGTRTSVRSLRHRPQRLEHARAIPRV
jgi:hypothetical protein